MTLQDLAKLQKYAPLIYTTIGVGSVVLFVTLAVYFFLTSK